jgi:crotonobetainyl-CoA:carnitine CoA-transferase CaiB-like acyl-CoA transferase
VPLLTGIRIVTTALNLPGPWACARLRGMGATVDKVEPPDGDPLERYAARWYTHLHAGITRHRLDLKTEAGKHAVHALLEQADVLVTAQRPAALARIGLGGDSISHHARLCHVAIVGHAPPEENRPGHDLTYLATHGLAQPPRMPPTLMADMAGGERAAAEALALVIARGRTGKGAASCVALADVARDLAQPLREGLTAPGGLLGGGLAGYNFYAAAQGWIALAALEPRFFVTLAQLLGLQSATNETLAVKFRERTAREWEEWARANDVPLVAVRFPLQETDSP